jgi:hypothetical protein
VHAWITSRSIEECAAGLALDAVEAKRGFWISRRV